MSELIKKIAEQNGFSHCIDMIIDLYSEPHRKYHNIDHIEDLIAIAMHHGYGITDPIMTAILFHDIVYYPVCRYNEELSADVYWSQSVGGDGYHSPAEEHIFEAIKASKNHCAMSNDALPHWAKNFLDYDLSGLAGLNYRDNGKKIWEEYKPFVSLDQFVEGRTKFLKGMLDAPQIYWNHPVWERQARRNMLDELMELHQGIYKFC